MNEQTLQDFLSFAKLHQETWDVDSTYPVLRAIHDHLGLDTESRLAHLMLFVAYYRLESGHQVWERYMNDRDYQPLELMPTKTERRGLRTYSAMRQHIADLYTHRDHFGSWEAWLKADWKGEPYHDWTAVDRNVRWVWNNGRWAGYKVAELLQKVLGWPILPPNVGAEGDDHLRHGPGKGMIRIFGETQGHAATVLTDWGWKLQDLMVRAGIEGPPNGDSRMPLDQALVESSCCDFDALCEGRYYIGEDMDGYLEHVHKSTCPTHVKELIFIGRKAALPHEYLGELGGWNGIDKARSRWYIDHHRIEGRSRPAVAGEGLDLGWQAVATS